MATLVWDKSGERRFEAGIDRGVLYPRGREGVAWNGLISVNEKPSGAGTTDYYIDGVRYMNQPLLDDFSASIEAYTYPDEFSECDGMAFHSWGFGIDNQRRRPFNLSYRTKVGNDIDGLDHAYKLHLVYNALATPSDRGYQSLSDNANPVAFSWDITATPVPFPGYRPSAHFVFDTRRVTPDAMAALEVVLYGTETEAPTFPQPSEIITIIESSVGLRVTVGADGIFTVTGPDTQVKMITDTEFQLSAENVSMLDPDRYVVTDES